MRIILFLLITSTQIFAQSEKISLKFLSVESSDKKLKKELGNAFSTFKKDGIEGKLVVDSAWQVEVVIIDHREEKKNVLDLWVVKETFKKQSDPEQYYLIHKTGYSYETAFDLERGAVGTHDPLFLKTMIFLSSKKSQGELTGKRVSRHISKESSKNKYSQVVVTMYSLNSASGQLKVQGSPMSKDSLIDLINSFQK